MCSTFVDSAWSFVFSSKPQRQMTSEFEGFQTLETLGHASQTRLHKLCHAILHSIRFMCSKFHFDDSKSVKTDTKFHLTLNTWEGTTFSVSDTSFDWLGLLSMCQTLLLIDWDYFHCVRHFFWLIGTTFSVSHNYFDCFNTYFDCLVLMQTYPCCHWSHVVCRQG